MTDFWIFFFLSSNGFEHNYYPPIDNGLGIIIGVIVPI